jgi:hypothetical protein
MRNQAPMSPSKNSFAKAIISKQGMGPVIEEDVKESLATAN